MNETTPTLLTSVEVARILGVSRKTLCTWVRSGIFPAHRVGRAYRYSCDALQAWLATHSNYGTAYKS